MRKLVILFAFLSLIVFSLSPKAQSYYTAGVSAMSVGDCRSALEWFKQALLEDPTLEDSYPNVKLWMGVCAYEIGNYALARDLLKLFPDNELARTIIKRIDMGLSPEEKEWLVIKDLIKKNVETLREVTPPSTPSTPSTSTEASGKSPILLFLGIFVIVFAALMIAEMKFALVSSMIAKIPKVRIVIGEAEVVREVVHETMTEEKEEEEKVEEKEIEIDLEELMNASLDTVDRLIYGEEFAKVEEEEEVKESEIEKVAEELVLGVEEGEKEEDQVEEEMEIAEETEKEEVEEAAEMKEAEETQEVKEEVKEEESEEKEEEEIEIKIETKSEELTEEDIKELEKKFKEIISEEEEEEEEEIPLELAGKSPQEIMEELEEKEEYDEEDAEKLVYAIEKLLKGEEEG